MKATIQTLARLLTSYYDTENEKEYLGELIDLSHDLKKEYNSEFEQELGKEIERATYDIAQDKYLCPECFSQTVSKQLYAGDYYNPPEYAICCPDCGWRD